MHRYDAMFPMEGCASTSRFAQFIRLTGITRHYKPAKTKNLRKLLRDRLHVRVRRRRGVVIASEIDKKKEPNTNFAPAIESHSFGFDNRRGPTWISAWHRSEQGRVRDKPGRDAQLGERKARG